MYVGATRHPLVYPMRTVRRLGPGCHLSERRGWYHLRFRSSKRTPSERSVGLDTDEISIAIDKAERLYARYRADLYDPWEHDARVLTIRQAADEYLDARSGIIEAKTARNYIYVLESFAETLPRAAHTLVRDVRTRDLERFVHRQDLAQATKASYRRKLAVVFGWFRERGLVDTDPMQAVERPVEPQPVPKYLTEDQLATLLRTVEGYHGSNANDPQRRAPNRYWDRDAFELIAHTGLRRGEAERLQWGDVVWPRFDEPGYLYVQSERGGTRTKSRAGRSVTMSPGAERVLRRLELDTRISNLPSEPVLKNYTGREPISAKHLSDRFRYYRKQAKGRLPAGVNLHGLRHTYAAMLRRRGAPLTLIREELGHKDIKTTMKYLAIAPGERARITRALWDA